MATAVIIGTGRVPMVVDSSSWFFIIAGELAISIEVASGTWPLEMKCSDLGYCVDEYGGVALYVIALSAA